MKPEDPKVPYLREAGKKSKWKKLYGKKWFFPAVYLTVAALVLTLAWTYQGHNLQQVMNNNKDSFPVNTPFPGFSFTDMILPVAENAQAEKFMGFYDDASSSKDKEASLVRYSNTVTPHAGLDFARKDGKTFDVVAALTGKVTRVEENPAVGYEVEILSSNGITTVYQSLADLKVHKGQAVKQGEVLAKAGRNNYEKEAGNHLHFEVRKGNQPLNPADYLKK